MAFLSDGASFVCVLQLLKEGLVEANAGARRFQLAKCVLGQ